MKLSYRQGVGRQDVGRHDVVSRIARWHIFETKMPIWVNFAIKYVGILYGHLVFLRQFGIVYDLIRYILWLFYIFSPFWYDVPRKIWQPWSVDMMSVHEMSVDEMSAAE
jgi:hypothetical protein